MNKIISAIAITCITLNCQGQTKYEANEYDVRKEEKAYSYKSTGQMFRDRMESFWKISNSHAATFINLADYKAFLTDFSTLNYVSDSRMNERLKNFQATINYASNTPHISQHGYRNKLYHIAYPVQMAIKEEWGDDVMDVVLTDSWTELNKYISGLAKDDYSLAEVGAMTNANHEKDVVMVRENAKTCTYKVNIDKPLQKDNIEIYFCETRVAENIRNLNLYPQDRLLTGPIGNYKTLDDESENLMHYLENRQQDKANNIHYLKFNSKSPSYQTNVELNESTEWYMFAFRNGALYYSYMALPCSKFNTCTIKEQIVPKEVQQFEEQLKNTDFQ